MRLAHFRTKAFVLALALVTGSLAEAQVYSDLWGVNGEKWSPSSRLPDFSFAGYKFGSSLPSMPVVVNVKNFGAKGDGITDDTNAFKDAISAASNGAVYIPAGKYVIRKRLTIGKSNVVLRGAGRSSTTLYFPDQLTTAEGPDVGVTTGGVVTSNYSWSHGFIEFVGQDTSQDQLLAKVTSEVARGSKTFQVDSASKLSVGMQVLLTETDDGDNSLAYYLNAQQYAAGADQKGLQYVNLVSKIKAINGNQVTLERPIRLDIKSKWSPRLFAVSYSVQNVGAEGFTMEFPARQYPGHHKELGYNGMQFDRVKDCWLKDIGIKNADSGIFLMGSRSCTFDGLVFDAYSGRVRTGATKNETGNGHHGIYCDEATADLLMQNFEYHVQFVHEISVGKGSNGNVFRNGSGVNIAFDNHGLSPYENLYTNIDAGDGSRSIYFSGGGAAADWGPHTSARTTFWNIKAASSQNFPNRLWPDWSPDQLNLVGVYSTLPSEKNATRRWFEVLPPAQLSPQDLYIAQVNRRIASGDSDADEVISLPSSGAKNLVVAHSGQCMDLAGSSTAAGAKILQWTCGSLKANQLFEFVKQAEGYQIKVKLSGMCLDIPNASKADGALLIQYTCKTSNMNNQLFKLINVSGSNFSLKNVNSGKCLEISAASKMLGVQFSQYTCNGKPHQMFSQK